MGNNDLFTLKREAAAEPFKAQVGDAVLSFPHIGDVDQFALAELVNDAGSDLDYMTGMFRLLLSDEDMAALRAAKLTRNELVALFDAYKGFTGADEGESDASAG